MTQAPRAIRRETFLHSIGAGAVWRTLEKAASLAKHVIIAGAIGLTAPLDVFYMANALLVIVLYGWSGLLETVALPRLVALRKAGAPGAFDGLAGSLLTLSVLVSAALAGLIFVAAEPLSLLAPGFEPARREMLAEALRWMAPVVVLYPTMRTLGSFYRATRQASVLAQAELLMGLGVLASVAAFPQEPRVLLWSYVVGAALGCGYLLARASRWVRLWGHPLTAEVRACLAAAPALLMVLTLTYTGQLIDRMFQSYLPPGAIGALSYAWVLVSLVPGLLYFGSAFMTVFSERRQAGESGVEVLQPLVSVALLVGVPATGFLMAFGDGVVRLLLERGGFSAKDTIQTATALAGYAPGLCALMLMAPLKQVFQVLERNGVLLVRVLLGLVANVGLNVLFVLVLGWGAQGIALAFSLSQTALLALSFRFLHAQGIRLDWASHGRFATYMAAGTLVGLGGALAWHGLGRPVWLVVPQALGFALVLGAWAIAAPGPEGALIRRTARRFWPRRPVEVTP